MPIGWYFNKTVIWYYNSKKVKGWVTLHKHGPVIVTFYSIRLQTVAEGILKNSIISNYFLYYLRKTGFSVGGGDRGIPM